MSVLSTLDNCFRRDVYEAFDCLMIDFDARKRGEHKCLPGDLTVDNAVERWNAVAENHPEWDLFERIGMSRRNALHVDYMLCRLFELFYGIGGGHTMPPEGTPERDRVDALVWTEKDVYRAFEAKWINAEATGTMTPSEADSKAFADTLASAASLGPNA